MGLTGTLIKAAPLYTFLWHCEKSGMEKTVLDCGAGGARPPLAIFAERGFKTCGIECDEAQIALAERFARENRLELDIRKGDIRRLPFPPGSISFLYCYNTIFHLSKADIRTAIEGFHSVLRGGGLMYVNLLCTDDQGYGEGQSLGPGEYLQDEGEHRVIHTYFEQDEPDALFAGYEMIRKEKRTVETYEGGERYIESYLDYTARKIP